MKIFFSFWKKLSVFRRIMKKSLINFSKSCDGEMQISLSWPNQADKSYIKKKRFLIRNKKKWFRNCNISVHRFLEIPLKTKILISKVIIAQTKVIERKTIFRNVYFKNRTGPSNLTIFQWRTPGVENLADRFF